MTCRTLAIGWLCIGTLFAALLAAAGPAPTPADPLIGTFATNPTDAVQVKITIAAGPAADSYTGTIERNNKSTAFQARRDANNPNRLSGTYAVGDRRYHLTGTLAHNQLTLTLATKTYVLAPVADASTQNSPDGK